MAILTSALIVLIVTFAFKACGPMFRGSSPSITTQSVSEREFVATTYSCVIIAGGSTLGGLFLVAPFLEDMENVRTFCYGVGVVIIVWSIWEGVLYRKVRVTIDDQLLTYRPAFGQVISIRQQDVQKVILVGNVIGIHTEQTQFTIPLIFGDSAELVSIVNNWATKNRMRANKQE